MAAIYESIVYDLNQFGVKNLSSAIILSDKDSGVSISVSFDGGSTFNVYRENEKIDLNGSNGKIKVNIIFDNDEYEEYLIPVTSYFQMLSIGTSLFFENNTTKRVYKTAIGLNGKYSISLPTGLYKVWYKDSNKNDIVLNKHFNPWMSVQMKDNSMIKENIVEMMFRDIDWAKYCIFDVFENLDKIKSINAELDINGNLIDINTNKVCKWWAIGLA